MKMHSFEKTLDYTIKLCENRRDNDPYKESVAYLKLQELEAKYDFTLEKQREIQDCGKWAKEGAQRKDAPDVDTLLKFCQKGERLLRCMDNYKAGVKLSKPSEEHNSGDANAVAPAK